MKIEIKPVHELKPAPYNPRVSLQPGMPEYARLKRSLQEFDLVQPLVWNKQTGHVVGGHQRLSLLKADGVQEVPVVVVSLSLEREKALNVTLNNEQVGGRWDGDLLQQLLQELIELPDFDATLTGFSEQELNSLLMSPAAGFVPEAGSDQQDDRVTVTLKVGTEDWENFREALDELLEQYDVETHVKSL